MVFMEAEEEIPSDLDFPKMAFIYDMLRYVYVQ